MLSTNQDRELQARVLPQDEEAGGADGAHQGLTFVGVSSCERSLVCVCVCVCLCVCMCVCVEC